MMLKHKDVIVNKFVTCALALGTLASCVSTNSATSVEAKTNSTPMDLSTPKLMEKSVAELGDDMLVNQAGAVTVKEYNIVKTTDKLEASSITKTPELSAGSIGKEAIGKNGEFSACFDHSVCMYDKDKNNRFETITHSGSMVDLSTDIGYVVEAKTEQYTHTVGLKRTLIYQGVTNGKLKLKYREYAANTFRQAFDQDFEVDIIQDGITQFGFKGSRFEVLNATSSQISYKVTAYFN